LEGINGKIKPFIESNELRIKRENFLGQRFMAFKLEELISPLDTSPRNIFIPTKIYLLISKRILNPT